MRPSMCKLIEESLSHYEGCSHEKRIDESGYPRAILEEGTLCPPMQEIQSKLFKSAVAVTACKAQKPRVKPLTV
jgi:hypothetical protein